jgi:hypothetical protein
MTQFYYRSVVQIDIEHDAEGLIEVAVISEGLRRLELAGSQNRTA